MFHKVLIANRGEIAVRVIRACREMGIIPIAVFSEADRASLHVRMADEAYPIGAAASSESYLSIEKIIGAALRSRADAIHPGYGFLSENPSFAEACVEAGVVFVGPSSASMRLLGGKTGAREAMAKSDIPIVPGTMTSLRSFDEAVQTARAIGYPIMLKAAAGGGGKGMRLVAAEEDLASSFAAATSEALRAFGDGSVYVEKFIRSPRHIEIQVVADSFGNAIYLGERECSIQRRHQKVIEECPSPALDPVRRARMGETALRVVRAAGYVNAGTVEFLLDEEGNHYFLEMNTRLQVEHPVTECVTGLDLVHEQIRIAAGGKLSLRQEDLNMRGWAIECRVYAEDPENRFFPSPGIIRSLREPQGPGIRVDSGIYAGWEVPIHYDPLLAKLIAWGASRQEAIERMIRALREYEIQGIRTNLRFLAELVADPEFRAGRLSTVFIEEFFGRRKPPERAPRETIESAAIVAALAFKDAHRQADVEPARVGVSAWRQSFAPLSVQFSQTRRPSVKKCSWK